MYYITYKWDRLMIESLKELSTGFECLTRSYTYILRLSFSILYFWHIFLNNTYYYFITFDPPARYIGNLGTSMCCFLWNGIQRCFLTNELIFDFENILIWKKLYVFYRWHSNVTLVNNYCCLNNSKFANF